MSSQHKRKTDIRVVQKHSSRGSLLCQNIIINYTGWIQPYHSSFSSKGVASPPSVTLGDLTGISLSAYMWDTNLGIGWVAGLANPTGVVLMIMLTIIVAFSHRIVRKSGHFEVSGREIPIFINDLKASIIVPASLGRHCTHTRVFCVFCRNTCVHPVSVDLLLDTPALAAFLGAAGSARTQLLEVAAGAGLRIPAGDLPQDISSVHTPRPDTNRRRHHAALTGKDTPRSLVLSLWLSTILQVVTPAYKCYVDQINSHTNIKVLFKMI